MSKSELKKDLEAADADLINVIRYNEELRVERDRYLAALERIAEQGPTAGNYVGTAEHLRDIAEIALGRSKRKS